MRHPADLNIFRLHSDTIVRDLDGDYLEGLDVDLGKALAAQFDLSPEYVYFGYDGLYDALLAGKVDPYGLGAERQPAMRGVDDDLSLAIRFIDSRKLFKTVFVRGAGDD